MPTTKIKNPASTAPALPRGRKRGEQKSKIKNSSKRVNEKPATTENTEDGKKTRNNDSVFSVVARKISVKGLKADVFDTKGKLVESINLPVEVFGAKINHQLMAQAVRVYLANQRKGTAATKTRGEVKGSTRKIYRQKGTGRARHGAIRAPIFVGGGVVFGPKPRDYSLELPKKMKKKALFSALSLKHKNGEIKIVSNLEKIEPKTKAMVEIIKKLSLNGEKILLVLPEKKENVQKSARNIEGLEMILADQLNAYEVLRNKKLLFMRESIEFLNKKI